MALQVLITGRERWCIERRAGFNGHKPKPLRLAPQRSFTQRAVGKHVLFQALDPATTWAPAAFNMQDACVVLEGPTELSGAEEEEWRKYLVG